MHGHDWSGRIQPSVKRTVVAEANMIRFILVQNVSKARSIYRRREAASLTMD